MSQRIVIAAAGALAALATESASAQTRLSDEQLIDACIGQYIHENLGDYPGKVTVRKFSATHYQPLLVGQFQNGVSVSAYHRTTGRYLGEVTCELRGNDIVLTQPDPAAAEKLAQLSRVPTVARTE